MESIRKITPNSPPSARLPAAARLLALLAAAGGALLIYRKGEGWLRSSLLYLAGARWARTLVTGFPPAWRMASRFVAGESLDEAIAATQQLNRRGLAAALDFLGESVENAVEAIKSFVTIGVDNTMGLINSKFQDPNSKQIP